MVGSTNITLDSILNSRIATTAARIAPALGSVITSGSINATGSLTYTATQNCCAMFTFCMQANSNGILTIKVNDITYVDIASNEAFNYTFAVIPIYLAKGDKIYFYQSSNRASSYKIIATK